MTTYATVSCSTDWKSLFYNPRLRVKVVFRIVVPYLEIEGRIVGHYSDSGDEMRTNYNHSSGA
jgi:hypothetical protein